MTERETISLLTVLSHFKDALCITQVSYRIRCLLPRGIQQYSIFCSHNHHPKKNALPCEKRLRLSVCVSMGYCACTGLDTVKVAALTMWQMVGKELWKITGETCCADIFVVFWGAIGARTESPHEPLLRRSLFFACFTGVMAQPVILLSGWEAIWGNDIK